MPKDSSQGKRGRPPHLPTAESRLRVFTAALTGQDRRAVAAALGIGVATLARRYAEELSAAKAAVSRSKPAGRIASAPDARLLLPTPPPHEVYEARLLAGHTQTQAAAVIGCSRWQTWSAYENGRRNIQPLEWAWYLLVTAQHPSARLQLPG